MTLALWIVGAFVAICAVGGMFCLALLLVVVFAELWGINDG